MGAKISPEPKACPGPGSYEDMRQLHYKTLTGSKMGKDARKSYFLLDSTYKNPNPDSYTLINFADGRLGAPNFGFGSSKRMAGSGKGVPGPGQYEVQNMIAQSLGPKSGTPVYSMPPRRKDLRPKTGVGVPGADTYNPSNSLTKLSAPNWSVSRLSRERELRHYKKNPDVGKYFIDSGINSTHLKSATWM
jgi:hypothetical protein